MPSDHHTTTLPMGYSLVSQVGYIINIFLKKEPLAHFSLLSITVIYT